MAKRMRKPSINTYIYKQRLFNVVGDEYSLIGEYVVSSQKVRIRHNICGHEWDVMPSTFLTTGTRCPVCSSCAYTTSSFRDKVTELTNGEYEFIDEYISQDTYCNFRHNTCGTVYSTRPKFFIKGNRCPQCNRRKEHTHEEFLQIVKEAKGDTVTILDQYRGLLYPIKIRNNNCGHEYEILAISLTKGHRLQCPLCPTQKEMKKLLSEDKLNDRPSIKDINDIVHSKSNGEIDVIEYIGDTTKVRVKHLKCNHSFDIKLSTIKNNKKLCCRICDPIVSDYNSFVNKVKDLVGDEFEVIGKYEKSSKKIEMKHNKCGRTFMVTSSGFISRPTCRLCSEYRNEAYTTEEFAQKIEEQTDGEFTVIGEYKNLDTKILCKHKCGNEYYLKSYSLLEKRKGNMCPACSNTSASIGEAKIKQFLDKYGFKYKQQYAIDECRNKYRLNFDFAVFFLEGPLRCLIEFDGEQHFNVVQYFGEETTKRTQINDNIKNTYCRNHGIQLIRIPFWDRDNLETILKSKLLRPIDIKLSSIFNLI